MDCTEKDSVLILSGGVDSTTMLYEERERIALAITFDYGSKHNAREIPFAKWHCRKLGIRHIVIPLSFMADYFKSSLLLGGDEIPEGHYADDNMRSTVVPFRNGIMLSVAVGLAESNGLKYVMMANHSGDHTIYPDCTPEFVDAFDAAAAAGTFAKVRLRSPYTNISKADIVRRGIALGVDYSKTWSCYKGGDQPCGCCGTCVERREAFAEAGLSEDGITPTHG
ncbi:MAG: 7-cyano-7-deazaguanine synthase QueC [Prevotella sp.]|nr:7-cyano-7-deazaguanine synthase QueC [Prevotella sp.]